MAKLEIRVKDGAKENPNGALTMRDLDILIDGQQPSHLLGVQLNLSTETFNEATITFGVENLQVDADVLAMLEAKVKEDEQ